MITGLSAQLMSPKKSKVKAGMKKAKRNAKSLKPLLVSVLQARLDDGPQISRQRIDIWSYKQADSEPGAASQTEGYDGNQHCVQKCLLHASHWRQETGNDRDTIASSKIASLFIES